MRLLLVAAVFGCVCAAQELPRFEVKASFWRPSVNGQLQSGIIPVDFRSDLALQQDWQFFGTALIRVGRRHGIVVEGAPLAFTGRNQLSRTVEYDGRLYNLRETLESEASMTYFFAGYQWDFLARQGGHLGLRTGGAFLEASGQLRSVSTGVTAARSYRIGLPLVGLAGRGFLYRRVVDVDGDVQGMSLGGYGHYVQGGASIGVNWRGLGFRGGYRVIDADVHERGEPGASRLGVAPRFFGPIFSVGWRSGE